MAASELFETLITARLERDGEKIATDLFSDLLETWEYDDVQITRELVEDAVDGAQYRLNLGADMAAWSGNQLGRLDAFTEGRPDQLIHWELDPGADHCDTCLEYNKRSPFKATELPGIPGQAPTDCNGSCRCNLVPVGTK